MTHPDLVLKNSKIEGKGVFAKKTIPKGTILFIVNNTSTIQHTRFEVAKFSNRFKKFLKNFGYNYNGLIVYDRGIDKFWNHSCNPTCADYNDKMIAIKDIKPGEEITYDYSFDERNEKNSYIELMGRACRCGADNCRGKIKPESKSSKAMLRLNKLVSEAVKEIPNVKQPLMVKK